MKSTLYCGDCLELMNRIPNSSIDMVLSDLPYGTTRCRWDTPINLQELWEQYRGQGKAPASDTETRGPAGISGQDLHEPRRDSPGQLHGSWQHWRGLHEYRAGICRDRVGSGILPDCKRKD